MKPLHLKLVFLAVAFAVIIRAQEATLFNFDAPTWVLIWPALVECLAACFLVSYLQEKAKDSFCFSGLVAGGCIVLATAMPTHYHWIPVCFAIGSLAAAAIPYAIVYWMEKREAATWPARNATAMQCLRERSFPPPQTH